MPPKGWSTEVKLVAIAALAIIVINLFTAHKAYGQTIAMSDTLPGNYYGITRCDSVKNVPMVIVRSGRSDFETHMTILHELVHVRQMANYPGGCKAAQERYSNDPIFRFKMETEAYCVDTDFEINLDKREFMLDELAMKMFDLYGRGYINYVDGKKIVYDICNKMRGSPALP